MYTVSPIPQGFHSVTPHMVIKNAGEARTSTSKPLGPLRFPASKCQVWVSWPTAC